MTELTAIYILSFIIVVLLPLIGVLAKDGARLFKSIKTALADGKLTDVEIDIILKDTGIVLRTVVRIIEKIFYR